MAGLRISSGDVWGGLAASAVALPQTMAFGVALFAIAGLDPAGGAVIGLVGASLICLMTGAVGGADGMISAPTGPTLVLLGGAVGAMFAAATPTPVLLTGLAALIVITGALQILIGWSGGGQLIKYIPHPVISGFMTGSAALMFMSQWKPASGVGAGDDWAAWRWIPIVAAAATFVATRYGPRLVPKLPGTIAGLIVGTVVFHALALTHAGPVPEAWVIGALPELHPMAMLPDFGVLDQVPWAIVLPAAVALSILGSLDTLLTAVICDVMTRTRHDARREMIGQGLGQILAGLAGGMAGAGTTGSSIVAVRSGGRRYAALVTAFGFAVLLLVAGPVAAALPLSVLAGIIIVVGWSMVDFDILTWLRTQRGRSDAAIALLVTGITVGLDLMIAVGVGVAIAILMFVRQQIKMPVVQRRSDATQVRSVRRRTQEEREILTKYGVHIVIYELRGNLFFATADRLLEALAADLDGPNQIILHMRRVTQIDLSAIRILHQLAERLHRSGGSLSFCNVHHAIGLGDKVESAMTAMGADASSFQVITYIDRDEALEAAEDMLLSAHGVQRTHWDEVVALADTELCSGLAGDELAAVESAMTVVDLEAGARIFSAGEHGDALYLVVGGEVDILLPTTAHHHKRLAACGPGTMFGELALVSPGPRVADAVSRVATRLLRLDGAGLTRLRELHPHAANHLLHAFSRMQSEYLRWATNEIRRLSEW